MNTINEINPVYVLKEVLRSVNACVAEAEAKLAKLQEDAKAMVWGSIEERANYSEQRYIWGELKGLAHAQGVLEGRISVTEIWLS